MRKLFRWISRIGCTHQYNYYKGSFLTLTDIRVCRHCGYIQFTHATGEVISRSYL